MRSAAAGILHPITTQPIHAHLCPYLLSLQVNSNAPVKDCNPSQPGWDIAGALDAYKAAGVPMEKIVLGLATYGRWESSASTGVVLGDAACLVTLHYIILRANRTHGTECHLAATAGGALPPAGQPWSCKQACCCRQPAPACTPLAAPYPDTVVRACAHLTSIPAAIALPLQGLQVWWRRCRPRPRRRPGPQPRGVRAPPWRMHADQLYHCEWHG